MTAITLNLKPFVELSDEQFYQLCLNHRELKFERTAEGKLVIVSPVGGVGGSREADLIADLVYWNRHNFLAKFLVPQVASNSLMEQIALPMQPGLLKRTGIDLQPNSSKSFRQFVPIL